MTATRLQRPPNPSAHRGKRYTPNGPIEQPRRDMASMQTGSPIFNFVVASPDAEVKKYSSAADLSALVKADPQILPDISSKGHLCWCLQSFLILRNRGNLPVLCSNEILRDAVNIVHSDHLLNLRGRASDFLVCVRADYPRRRWAQYHLVQNKAQIASNTSYIPLWLQPGLVKRDDRRIDVRTVAYAGEIVNGNLAGGIDAWTRAFEPHGLEFVPLPSSTWHDLSGIDVLIGVRSFDRRSYDGKPPSKLLNGWHARIPFVGGYDSAFTQVGVPGEDYLRAGTSDEVVKAVLSLRADPGLYARLVESGARRAERFGEQAIAEIWEQVLLGPVMRRFERWRSASVWERARFDLGLGAGLLEHGSKQVIKRIAKALALRPWARLAAGSAPGPLPAHISAASLDRRA